ncbi:MAG: hypothetical protein SFY66_13330 [Oculatellaceae cyanobacterium bins.114]|nr:hypothetical protein [Oculatellaceae cyanobacterium bins.114]
MKTISAIAYRVDRSVMSSAVKYWKFVRLDATGKRQIEEIAAAKTFLLQHFGEDLRQSELTDTTIQRQLWQIWQNNTTDSETRRLAEICLRCYISNQIEQVCLHLEGQFGSEHGFTRYDLFPLVLNDVPEVRRFPQVTARTTYRSLATDILQSFDPTKASLSTWATRLVRHDKEVNAFLLDHGIYLISDWAILNDTTPKQLQRILAEFHALTIAEIHQATHLLQGYHLIYRQARLQQRQSGAKGQCPPPTPEQLRRIAQYLEGVTQKLTPEATLSRLQTLATLLRQYRIYVRGGAAPTESLDQPEQQALAAQLLFPERDTEQEAENEFLTFYRNQFLTSLDQTLAQVTSDRLGQLRRKGCETIQQFLSAMYLFHCEGRSMTEIAVEVGLQAQYQVTRLLKLKEFRAEVRQHLLLTLRDRILDKAKEYADPNRLKSLDQTLEAALDEQIAAILQQAEAEASVAKHCPLDSLFARRLCQYLDHRNTES